jgi:O-antigen/teichoic acid export membrane protein
MLATGHEKKMIIPVGIGALVNIVGNALLIPQYAELGATIASVCSEIIVMIIYVCMGKHYFKLVGTFDSIWKVVVSSVFMGVYLFGVGELRFNGWIIVGMQIVGAIIIYGVMLICLKESVATEYINQISKILKKKTSV